MSSLFHPAGTIGDDDRSVIVTPGMGGLDYGGLEVVPLASDSSYTFATGTREVAVLPLSGGVVVEVEDRRFELTGREGVFKAVTDFAYTPIDTEVRITATRPGEIALCTAEATRHIDPYRVDAQDIRIEVRGGGVCTRQINNFLSADMFDADKLICVEVITPEGGWSSYPPHKHDEFTEDEVKLEEIYYFRIDVALGTAFFSCYTPDDSINETVTVRDGDIYLVPRGYHGPAAATPGHHMYYLNIMAGPAEERVWRFTEDPDHAWARPMLEAQPPDPRLPLTGPR
ncbi:MAG: 5-deoxy-glucuronate isomerase [Egibacteraceae bacterium]